MNSLILYNSVKEDMKTGDLLLWSSNSFISLAIKKYTKSNFSHASLLIRFDEYDSHKRYNLEAGSHGTELNVLSKTLEEYDGTAWWYPLKDDWDSKRKAIGDMSLSLIGIPYDYGSLFKYIVGNVSANSRKLFCSEYCYICYGFDGKAPVPGEMINLGIFKEGIKII